MKMMSFAAGLLLAASVVPAFAATYAVDPVHSSTSFRIKHAGVAFFYGRFDAPAGTVSYDAANPEATTFNVTLDAGKVNTGNENRDNHLKSPAFFNVKEFPTMTFKSTSVKKIDDTTLEVTGELTIHGVTKPLTTKMEMTGTGKDQKGNPLVGFETTFTVNRNDFGITQYPGMLGDDVRFTISIEAGQK